MESSESLKKTVLTDTHLALGAKMAPFGGFLMPIQYEGIIKEHVYTRQQATLFDTCHMGEFSIKGGSALADLEKILTCPVGSMQIGQCRYGFICNESGGVLDDQIIYRMGENEFFMVVNAATQDSDFAWVKSHLSADVQIENLSATTAKIDLQGPAAPRIMQKLVADPIDGMKYFFFRHTTYRGGKVLISRTGYTGEIGFEFYCDNDLAVQFWNDCMELGAKPAGLGCRDTLRLEIGMPLYGHELAVDRNAAESGLSRSIAGDKQFIGANVVLDKSQTRSLLVGIELQGRRASRNGDAILNEQREPIGIVTSGSFSPSLEKALALGYVSLPHTAVGTRLLIDTGRQTLAATVVNLPFYKNATGRAKMADYL